MKANRSGLTAKRTAIKLVADPKRVLTRMFLPGDPSRVQGIIRKILAMDSVALTERLDKVMHNFSSRHKNIEKVFHLHYLNVLNYLDNGKSLSR